MADKYRSVAEFLEAQPAERRDEVQALRALVMDARPELVEIVKWNSPSYVLDGEDRLTINAAGKGPVRLMLHLGTGVAEDRAVASTFNGDPGGLLTWHSNIRASLPMPPPNELAAQREAMIAVIREWLALG